MGDRERTGVRGEARAAIRTPKCLLCRTVDPAGGIERCTHCSKAAMAHLDYRRLALHSSDQIIFLDDDLAKVE